ncbi:DUF2203 domain-containing protein [Dehalococcoidia bacterium]|nr:DUF2203 domain-containing protein [Dehalococcoidia bacterium]
MEKKRYFSLAEANRELPWLKAHLMKIASLNGDLKNLYAELETLGRKSRSNGHQDLERQIDTKHKDIDNVSDMLSHATREVSSNGIMLRDPDRGLVDFPSFREGREIYLCWLMDEDQISFWHDITTGLAGRIPL